MNSKNLIKSEDFLLLRKKAHLILPEYLTSCLPPTIPSLSTMLPTLDSAPTPSRRSPRPRRNGSDDQVTGPTASEYTTGGALIGTPPSAPPCGAPSLGPARPFLEQAVRTDRGRSV